MSAREDSERSGQAKARHDDTSPFSRLQARGEKLLDTLAGLRKNILPEGEQGLDALLGQIDRLRDSVSRRAQETGRDLEARAEQMLGDLEHEAVRRLGPVLTRANVLSRADVAPLESRLAHLEGRLGGLLDDRAALTSRVLELERTIDDTRAVASEREREASLALSTGDVLHQALAEVREHLDALSKDQVSRSLESGKLQDRLVRLEMRLGDILKDQGSRVSDQDDIRQRLARVNETLDESARTLRGAAEEAGAAVTASRQAATQIEALRNERTADRSELFQVAHRIGDVERSLRQIELRLGDLTERHTAGREEIASLAARVSQLELSAARPATAGSLHGQAEGH
jgi:chromosome segregation ATPase